jgi:hypothetical protein
VQVLPPTPKKFADSIVRVPSKTGSEIKIESISLI